MDKDELNSRLYKAVQERNVAEAERLIVAGADVNFPAAWMGTFLHWAVSSGSQEMVKLLLGHGARVDADDGEGTTPLFGVCFWENREKVDIARLLLAAGANPDARDGEGYTPLMTAAGQGSGQVAGVLLEAGADPTARNELDFGIAELCGNNEVRAMVEAAIRNWDADPAVRLARDIRARQKRITRFAPKPGPGL